MGKACLLGQAHDLGFHSLGGPCETILTKMNEKVQ